jgi:hypothetical protein
MARRSNTAEAPVETETTEAPEATTTETVEAAPEAPKAEVDLTAFKAAVEESISGKDASTGELPEGALDGPNKAYRDIDGLPGKNAARKWLDESMKQALVVDKDAMKARAFVVIKDGLSAGSSGAVKTPADPTTAFVQKVVAINIASTLVNESVPDGVSADWTDKAVALRDSLAEDVTKYGAWIADTSDEKGDAPDVSPVVRQAFKLATGKGAAGASGRVTGGPRRDVGTHLGQVFADLPVGSFLTVNEIAKAQSTEYGDDRPSAGAVSAHLFKKSGAVHDKDGIKGQAEADKPRGAVKYA